VPLPDKSVDVAVFCLALMGTNYSDYLIEAHRILRENGHLLIYEVVSRIEKLDSFITSVETVGFNCRTRDENNPMFVELIFSRRPRPRAAAAMPEAAAAVPLKPCIYKRR
jgi:ribosomal RNA-processing protein 8